MALVDGAFGRAEDSDRDWDIVVPEAFKDSAVWPFQLPIATLGHLQHVIRVHSCRASAPQHPAHASLAYIRNVLLLKGRKDELAVVQNQGFEFIQTFPGLL